MPALPGTILHVSFQDLKFWSTVWLAKGFRRTSLPEEHPPFEVREYSSRPAPWSGVVQDSAQKRMFTADQKSARNCHLFIRHSPLYPKTWGDSTVVDYQNYRLILTYGLMKGSLIYWVNIRKQKQVGSVYKSLNVFVLSRMDSTQAEGVWVRVLCKTGIWDCRKPENEDLHDLYYLPNTIRVIESRMRWEELGANTRRNLKFYRVLWEKMKLTTQKTLRLHVWMDNTEMDLTETRWEGVDWII